MYNLLNLLNLLKSIQTWKKGYTDNYIYNVNNRNRISRYCNNSDTNNVIVKTLLTTKIANHMYTFTLI